MEYTRNYLNGLTREELEMITKLWEGHQEVNYETTSTDNLIALILDAMKLT